MKRANGPERPGGLIDGDEQAFEQRPHRQRIGSVAVAIETYDAIAPLALEWDELAERIDAPPWFRAFWLNAWWGAFGEGRLELLAVRRGEALAGVLPLARRRGALHSPTNWHTPEFGPTVEDPAAAAELAHAASERAGRSLSLAFLDRESPLLRELRAGTAGRILERQLQRSPFVRVLPSFEAFEATRDRAFLKKVRKRAQRLEEQGEVAWEAHGGVDQLEEGFALEASGWKAAKGTAILSSPETRLFYTEVARWAAEQGWLRLHFMRVGGRAAAFQLLLVQGGRVWFLKGGYDPRYSGSGRAT